MPTIAELRQRVRATQKTQQITRTMQNVAASRLKRSEEQRRASRPYSERMEEFLQHLLPASADDSGGLLSGGHPFLEPRDERSVAVVVVTSDRGLCGTYNGNVIRAAEEHLKRIGEARLYLIGKKGNDYFKKRRWPIANRYLDLAGKVDFARIKGITEELIEAYLSGRADRIDLVYTTYRSALNIRAVVVKFLNLLPEESAAPPAGAAGGAQFIIEPDRPTLLSVFLPEYVASKMFLSLVEAFTAENSARMVAMKTATDNAGEVIEALTLARNKARQAAITKEILEIVTAGEALKAG